MTLLWLGTADGQRIECSFYFVLVHGVDRTGVHVCRDYDTVPVSYDDSATIDNRRGCSSTLHVSASEFHNRQGESHKRHHYFSPNHNLVTSTFFEFFYLSGEVKKSMMDNNSRLPELSISK